MKVINVAIGMIIRQNQVLICRRKNEAPLGGYWEFPGGKIEPGETPEQCIVREVAEETGITINVLETWPTIDFDYVHGQVRLHPHLCAHLNGHVRAISCQQAIWVPASKLNDYRFPPANDALIAELQRRCL